MYDVQCLALLLSLLRRASTDRGVLRMVVRVSRMKRFKWAKWILFLLRVFRPVVSLLRWVGWL